MTKLLLSYPGSKGVLARWHVTLFPAAQRYVSVFGGAASEFLHRRPSGVEVLNDIDSDIHNMFSAIRNPRMCAELQHLLRWTPDGRRQFTECKQMLDDLDSVRRAWAFLVIGNTGDIRSFPRKQSWYNAKHRICALPAWLDWWRDRMQRVKIECLPWQEVIDRYDRDGTLLYLDPPYHPDTLSSQGRLYRYVMTAGQHAELLLRLRRCRARVLLCGYPHPTYDSVLSDWVQLETACECVMGSRGRRTERVWLNYALPGGERIHE